MFKRDIELRKIGSINKQSESKPNCVMFGTLLTVLISFLVFKIAPFNYLEYLNNKDKIFEILMIIPVMIFIKKKKEYPTSLSGG